MLDTPRNRHAVFLSALQSRSLPITSNKLRYFQNRGTNIRWNCSSSVSLWAALYTNWWTEVLSTETPWIFAWIIRRAAASAANTCCCWMMIRWLITRVLMWVFSRSLLCVRQSCHCASQTYCRPGPHNVNEAQTARGSIRDHSTRLVCSQERPDRLWGPPSTQRSE